MRHTFNNEYPVRLIKKKNLEQNTYFIPYISRDKKCYLVKNDTLISDPQTVADKLARYFHYNSSDQNYDTEFLSIEKTRESRTFDTPHQYQNLDSYQILINSEITTSEFEIALSKCNSKIQDRIVYLSPFYTTYQRSEKHIYYFNLIWSFGIIPSDWKHSCIIPIPKEGKDKFSISGYHPISLLNTMCKLMENIINLRLVWFVEKINYLSPDLSLMKIQSEIENTMQNNQTLGIICLDIAKAYDTVWRPHIITNLQKILSKGNKFNFIKHFLSDRTFHV